MDSCDVLIVGGGPAGSSCAWGLRRSGLHVAILDRHSFPRNKICGGWITPAVLEELRIEPVEYACTNVLQPITGFETSYIGGPTVETHYGKAVSYGIRRFEFDDYLLRRSGAGILAPAAVESLERSGDDWIVNGRLRAHMLVGAGGMFCPVARLLGAKVGREAIVAAQEAEFDLDERARAECPVRGEVPQLFFCRDLKGYGWCFRKQNVLNVGIGRLDSHSLSRHAGEFLAYLKTTKRLSPGSSPALLGHAYVLYGYSARNMIADGVLLVGDAAGLAYAQSGEGIRPAIESGLLAADVIASSRGQYSRGALERYPVRLAARFGEPTHPWTSRLPAGLVSAIGRRLLTTHWFARNVVLNGWFLRRDQAAIAA